MLNGSKSQSISISINGMEKRNGFLWMGCPEEILSTLDELDGIENSEYDIELEQFIITYDLKKLNRKDIVNHINNKKFEVINVKQINWK